MPAASLNYERKISNALLQIRIYVRVCLWYNWDYWHVRKSQLYQISLHLIQLRLLTCKWSQLYRNFQLYYFAKLGLLTRNWSQLYRKSKLYKKSQLYQISLQLIQLGLLTCKWSQLYHMQTLTQILICSKALEFFLVWCKNAACT